MKWILLKLGLSVLGAVLVSGSPLQAGLGTAQGQAAAPVSGPPVPLGPPEPVGPPAPLAPAERPTLLAAYHVLQHLGSFNQPLTLGLSYRPRASALAGYSGWDLLQLPASPALAADTHRDFLYLTLNRPARLAVWLRGRAVPGWLAGWKAGATVGAVGPERANYWRDFPAGEVVLPGLGGGNADRPYWVLLGEAGSVPSRPPATPDGEVTPTPNAPCPVWLHDRYRALGPDGMDYPTWHPQIDPVYWCSFGHEHGSRPAAGYVPLYGYTASRHGMSEPHAGFKTYTIADGAARWTITQHFGTSGLGRACTRFHTVDVGYTVSGVLKADLHFMGDFGNGVTSFGQTASDIGCPGGQDKLRAQGLTGGTRVLLRSPNNGYEPWRVDLSHLILGFGGPGLTFDTGDAQTACADTACSRMVRRDGEWGADHRVTINRPLSLSSLHSGVFYTNPEGRTIEDKNAPGATRQYIQQGLHIVSRLRGTCSTTDAWVGLINCGGKLLSPDKNLEGGLRDGN